MQWVSALSLKMYGKDKLYNFFLCVTTFMSKLCAIWILWLWKNSPEPPIGRPPIHLLIQHSSEALAAPAELLRHSLWICNTISHLQRKLIYPLWPVVNQTSIHFPRLWEPSSRKCVAKQTLQQEPGSQENDCLEVGLLRSKDPGYFQPLTSFPVKPKLIFQLKKDMNIAHTFFIITSLSLPTYTHSHTLTHPRSFHLLL